eukprot:TRINITY_DN1395_c0_g1_i1.p1 TRINITY_DN1395_c0_g1~~TRINITY_DN1395_c0_g1_i1.p1  ORF type:complete len:311 (-),score=60.82 TRINITY_DN1395_c0_g1_i1:52-984(-)
MKVNYWTGLTIVTAVLAVVNFTSALLPSNNVDLIQPHKNSMNITTLIPFPGFDVTDVKNYVYYSYSSYCTFTQIQDWDCDFCVGDTQGFKTLHVSYDKPTDSVAVVGYHPTRQEIVISFRGTEPLSIKNWIDDVEFIKTPLGFSGTGDANVHQGFLDAYKAHSADLVASVLGLIDEYPDYEVVVTGHSLGGAMGAICAMDLAYNHNIDGVYVITFGSPRVGDAAFAEAFDNAFSGRCWRLTHQHDIVPHLPLKSMVFKHVATEVWFYSGLDYQICNGSGEDPDCSNSDLLNLSIPDHLTYMGVLYLACFH